MYQLRHLRAAVPHGGHRCPMGAIDLQHVALVPGTCIKCHSCVRRCTKHAKYFDDPAFLSHVAMLERNFTEPKENEVFL